MRPAFQEILPENNPKFYLLRNRKDIKSAAEFIGFPSVFKRTDFAGSLGIRRVTSLRELKEAFEEEFSLKSLPMGQPIHPVFLLEEYIEGRELSVEALIMNKEAYLYGIVKKTTAFDPYFIEVKHEFPAEKFGISSYQIGAVQALSKKIFKLMKLENCLCHLELRWDKKRNRPMIIELGIRAGGGHIMKLIKLATGEYVWSAWLRKCLGNAPAKKTNIPPHRGTASVQFIVASKSGYFRGLQHCDGVLRHKCYVSHGLEQPLNKKITVNKTYEDRVAYIIGYSETRKQLDSFQNLVSGVSPQMEL